MKLWLKMSIICTAVLLLIVSTCSTMLLITAKNQILSLTIESARTEQRNLEKSFAKMIQLYGNDKLGPIEKQSLEKYCFGYFANDASILISGNDELISNISFNPETVLPPSELTTLPQTDLDGRNYRLTIIKGANVLIVGSKSGQSSSQYVIYTVRDITTVYDSVFRLMKRFGAISVVCFVFGISLIIVLTKITTRPLKVLGKSVKRITQGEYTERVHITTNDEVGGLAQDFNSMAEAVQTHVEQLKEITHRQQLFIGGLTHEFKTPLTSVIGHAETLLYTKMPENVVESSLLYIHDQCMWLERLTQKMLRLITLQEGIELKDEIVRPLLEAVRDSTAEMMAKRGILLEIECGITTLPMDYDLMLSLLINLADNASKASAAGQTVSIHAHDRTIEVIDRGMGILQEELSRITEPFYMVDKSRSKSMGGVGLGLALVKRIADAHGAEIAIDSAQGQGTTVKVIFPDYKTFTFS